MHSPKVLVYTMRGVPLTLKSWRRWRAKRKSYLLPALVDVWHVEPDGRDSGTVCKEREDWKLLFHFSHLEIRLIPWRNFKNRFARCVECRRRMNTAVRFSYMSSSDVWHMECQAFRHLRGDMDVMTETMHRLFHAYSIDSEEDLRSLVVNEFEGRDQFLLWYKPWTKVEHYRTLDPVDMWRAPNEHLTSL